MTYEELSDTVADLKARVEALERELAAMKAPAIAYGSKDATVRVDVDALHAKWDNGKYDEGDFVA